MMFHSTSIQPREDTEITAEINTVDKTRVNHWLRLTIGNTQIDVLLDKLSAPRLHVLAMSLRRAATKVAKLADEKKGGE